MATMNRVSYAQLRQNVGSLHIVPCGMSRSSRPGVLLPIRCAAAARLPDNQAFLGRRPAYRQQLKVLPAVQTEKGSIAGFADEAYRLGLPPDEATKSLRFTEVRDGKDIRVVVSAVAEGSAAQKSGVRPGQRLLTVSDPINMGEDLEIVPGTKVKKVYDTIQLSRATEVSFQFSQSSVEDNPGFDMAKAQQGINLPQTGGSSQGSNVSATQSARPQGGKSEIEQKYAKRMEMRDDYMNKEPTADKPLFAGIFALLLVPALVILAIAFTSGYMDTISNGVTSTQ